MITQERTIKRAYFNDRRAPRTVDTRFYTSATEFDNPKHHKIMKVGKILRMNHLCKKNDINEECNIGATFKGDPRHSAKLSDSERKKIETKSRDPISKKEVLDDNMNNDP